MMKSTRRTFLKAATIASAGFMVAEGNAQEESQSPNERPDVACIGIGGKGGSDSDNAARFGNIVAICDVDRSTLENKGKGEAFQKAKKYEDFREMLEKHEKEIDIVTISTPDHMHTAQTLMAMRMGKSVYTQKPLTRSIYEARKMAEVAKETGVCTQMGNQGTAQDSSRVAIAQLKAGVIGTPTAVYVWSNRPVWAQKPGRRYDMTRFAAEAYESQKDNRANADKAIWAKYNDVQRSLERLNWQLWLGTAKYREFYPVCYHSFQWRGWWDFGSGALGDMACHQVTVPFAACGLKDPTWVRAKTTGHDFDSFPESSIIEFEFPANDERGKIPFWWFDRRGNRPPQELFAPYGIDRPADSGVLIIGEKGAFYSSDDYCGKYELRAKGGETIEPLSGVETVLATDKRFDIAQMYELFEAVKANDPKICVSNFVDRAGPLTETILLGNLAVWAAAEGGPEGAMGEWGEKIEWDAKNLVVTNLSDLKTPGVADLIKPVYTDGYRLD